MHGGQIVAEFFDIDKSRSIPPQRCPDRSASWDDHHPPVRCRSPGVGSRSLGWLPCWLPVTASFQTVSVIRARCFNPDWKVSRLGQRVMHNYRRDHRRSSMPPTASAAADTAAPAPSALARSASPCAAVAADACTAANALAVDRSRSAATAASLADDMSSTACNLAVAALAFAILALNKSPFAALTLACRAVAAAVSFAVVASLSALLDAASSRTAAAAAVEAPAPAAAVALLCVEAAARLHTIAIAASNAMAANTTMNADAGLRSSGPCSRTCTSMRLLWHVRLGCPPSVSRVKAIFCRLLIKLGPILSDVPSIVHVGARTDGGSEVT